jgi:hypothetical protein
MNFNEFSPEELEQIKLIVELKIIDLSDDEKFHFDAQKIDLLILENILIKLKMN